MKQTLNQSDLTERIKTLIKDAMCSEAMYAKRVKIDPGNFNKKLAGTLKWTINDVEKICSNELVSKEWLIDGIGEMKAKFEPTTKMLLSDFDSLPSKGYDKSVGKPYFNVDFEMGYDFMVNDQTRNPDYMIDFTPYNKCDCWCNAHGDSMRPTISSGDVIAIKEIKDFSYLISGEIYAIVTKNDLCTIKRIKDNGSTVTLIPDNKDYPEQVIDKTIIYKVFGVLGSMKMF